jgi:hypothetical protein
MELDFAGAGRHPRIIEGDGSKEKPFVIDNSHAFTRPRLTVLPVGSLGLDSERRSLCGGPILSARHALHLLCLCGSRSLGHVGGHHADLPIIARTNTD